MIDDFYLDHAFFTPSYVRSLQAKAKAINPRLAFVPVMYPTEVARGMSTPIAAFSMGSSWRIWPIARTSSVPGPC